MKGASMRLIDADALIINLMDRGIEGLQTDDFYEIQQAVDDAPTVDLVRRGKWQPDSDNCLVCSECGNPAEINGITGELMESPYCSECGAKME